MRTADYGEAARQRLGNAVREARESMGAKFKFRPAFARAAGIAKRSLDDLETGKPTVGETNLRLVGKFIPHWTQDTPQNILEGGEIPPNPPAPSSTEEGGATLPQHQWSAEAWQRMKSMSVSEALEFVEHERVMRGEATALLAMRAIVEAQEEARRERKKDDES